MAPIYSLIRYSLVIVRMKRLLPEMAGLAKLISPKLFLPISSYVSPGLITNVSPSSLRKNTLPSYAQGELAKV